MARRSDRVEGVLLAVVTVGVLIALPIAALIGSNAYRGQRVVSAEQQASRHLAAATLVENARLGNLATDNAYLGSPGGGSTAVLARWTTPDGVERVGTIQADPGTDAGTQVPVWLSSAGDPVTAPMTSSDVATTGVLTGIFSWLIAALGLGAMYWGARLVLDRRRVVRWDREWQYAGDHWARF